MHQFVVQDQAIIDEQIVNEKIEENDQVKIQFSTPIYDSSTLKQLDRLAFQNDSKLLIRFYSHYNGGFDCKLLEQIPNVKALAIDCIKSVKNVSALMDLKHLKKITLGIFELEDLDVLSFDSLKNVEKLSILDTKTNKVNLEFLAEFKNLRYLQIAGQTKNINQVSHLTQLKTLSLNSIRKTPLTFVNGLKSLETLRIILGGRDNINEIDENKIENLDVIWVRGFNDFSVLKNFTKLKSLLIQDQIQLKELHFPKLELLEDVKILNCKSLNVITGLEKLSSLTGLRISESKIEFNDFVKLSFPEKLKTVAFYTWKSKQDKLIRNQLDKMGYNEFG
jgi:protein phosphatase 1 regulatory subunit 7